MDFETKDDIDNKSDEIKLKFDPMDFETSYV